MNDTEFVNAVRIIMDNGIEGLLSAIQDPPGRNPDPILQSVSHFYKSLSEEQKQLFRCGIELAAKQSINNIFNVLDGSSAIEDSLNKGKLALFFVKGEQQVLLNDPDRTPLSEVFRECEPKK